LNPVAATALTLTLGAVNRTFAYRKGTVDEVVIAQALKVGAYDLARLRRGAELAALYERSAASGAPPLIVDTAANIGAAAVFFSFKFPKARIIALESDPANFALLVANTAGLPVECIQASVAAHAGAHTPTPHTTVNEIYRRAGDARPFIVRGDVETDDLFAVNTEWLRPTPIVVAALSDHLIPGTAASRRFVDCATGWDRDLVYAEDNLFSLSREPALKQGAVDQH
jgi:FkbM family methyltransferase